MENLTNLQSRKRRYSNSVGVEARNTISNCYSYLKNVKNTLIANKQKHLVQQLDLSNVKCKVASMCNISPRTVVNVVNNNDKENEEPSANNNREEQIVKRKRKYTVDDFTVAMIRRMTNEFYCNHQYPSVELLWKKCLLVDGFPQVSRDTFRRILIRDCKFKYRRQNKKPVYLERCDIRAQRELYLRSIKFYRNSGYKIYYSDETWTTPDIARNRCWLMHLTKEERQTLDDMWTGNVLQDMEGYVGGFAVKSAAGRVIINHIGSADGFLDGGDDIFISKKDSKDYHQSMDSERYLAWFKKIIELVPTKSVLVLDLAPYHRKKVEGTTMPTMAWLKAKIIDWLHQWNVPLPTGIESFGKLTKPTLVKLSKDHPIKPKFVVEDLAEKCGKEVKILWLPPAHCEFNPIELVWAFVKGYVAKHNTGKNLPGIEQLTREAINNVTNTLWEGCVEHAKKFEEVMWIRDNLKERGSPDSGFKGPLIIRLGDENEDSSSEDDFQMDSCQSDSSDLDDLEL